MPAVVSEPCPRDCCGTAHTSLLPQQPPAHAGCWMLHPMTIALTSILPRRRLSKKKLKSISNKGYLYNHGNHLANPMPFKKQLGQRDRIFCSEVIKRFISRAANNTSQRSYAISWQKTPTDQQIIGSKAKLSDHLFLVPCLASAPCPQDYTTLFHPALGSASDLQVWHEPPNFFI